MANIGKCNIYIYAATGLCLWCCDENRRGCWRQLLTFRATGGRDPRISYTIRVGISQQSSQQQQEKVGGMGSIGCYCSYQCLFIDRPRHDTATRCLYCVYVYSGI